MADCTWSTCDRQEAEEAMTRLAPLRRQYGADCVIHAWQMCRSEVKRWTVGVTIDGVPERRLIAEVRQLLAEAHKRVEGAAP